MSRSLDELERDRFLAEAESLSQITRHPAWVRFEELLTQMRLSAMEHMAQSTPEEFSYWQGVVATLREIKERPHQIIAVAQSITEEEQHRKQSERKSLDFSPRVALEDDL